MQRHQAKLLVARVPPEGVITGPRDLFLQLISEAIRLEYWSAIWWYLDAGSNLAEFRGCLENHDFVAFALKGDGHAETSQPSTADNDSKSSRCAAGVATDGRNAV